MQQPPSPDTKNHSKKSTIYFTIGIIFLFVMALLWSLDTSLIYILLGLASFFLFLGFYSRPVVPKQQDFYNRTYSSANQSPPSNTAGSETIFDLLSEFFKRKLLHRKPSAGAFSGARGAEGGKRVALVVIISIFVFIFVLVISLLTDSDSESYDEMIYYQTAEQNYWAGNYDSAYLNYRKAWKLNPEYAEAILGYGNVLAIQNKPDSAMIMFDRALELNPAYREANYAKSLVYYNQEKYNESIQILNDLIRNNPDYYDAMLLLGDNYYTQNKYDEAIPWYEKVYQEGQVRTRVMCHVMAYIYDTKGETGRAINLYKEVLGYDSTVVDIYKRLGELIPADEGNYYRTQSVKLGTQQR
jgi:predicted Zn-dependent protease